MATGQPKFISMPTDAGNQWKPIMVFMQQNEVFAGISIFGFLPHIRWAVECRALKVSLISPNT